MMKHLIKNTMNILKKIDKKLIFISALIIAISAIIYIGFGEEEVSFELKDSCGPIMNLISHTIADESACRTKCTSQCITKDLDYSRVDFELNSNTCNDCTCFCK